MDEDKLQKSLSKALSFFRDSLKSDGYEVYIPSFNIRMYDDYTLFDFNSNIRIFEDVNPVNIGDNNG